MAVDETNPVRQTRPVISVVSPVYYGEKMVSALVERNICALETITDNFEIILVNDASPDNSWTSIVEECSKDKRVKGLNLSRNFGQHYAISAGLAYAAGDWVVVMDCDLQDRPEEIPNLYAKALEGYDIVQARRVNKKYGWWKVWTSRMFHKILKWLGGDSDAAVGNFGIYSLKVISEFNKMPELARSFSSLLEYLGFRKAYLDVEHNLRGDGKSSYTLSKLFKLAFDVILSNSNKPLKVSVILGFVISFLAFVMALYNVIARLIGIITVPGYTTTIFSIWFVGGLILMVLGVLGLYIGKIFDQVKGRQMFIVADKINFDDVQ